MNRFSKGQAVQGAIIVTAIVVSVATEVGNWVVNHILSSPETQAASISTVENRVTSLETKQQSTDKTTLNQGNKVDYLVQAIQKIGSKVGADVGQPPINQ